MADKKDFKPVEEKFSEHRDFKLGASDKVEDGEKIYCLHCLKQCFAAQTHL